MQLRPRLFLEGNLFVDMQPGHARARRSSTADSVIPIEQTSNSVQFDQVLTTPAGAGARRTSRSSSRSSATRSTSYGGAEGFRESFRTSPAASATPPR